MYRGRSIDLPCGRGGLNGNLNSYLIPLSDLVKARNLRFDDYVWRKAPGLGYFDSDPISGTPTCYAGFDWRPDSGTQNQVTVWDNGEAYLESGGDIDDTTLVSGLTISNPVCLVEGGNISAGDEKKLYLFSKGVAPKELAGTGVTFDPITAESADWASNKPGAAVYHDFRIYAFDVDGAPHNFYISSLADHGDFNAADSLVYSVAPGVGDRIVAGISYLDQTLYLFKYPRGIWEIDTTSVADGDATFLPTTLIRDDLGAAGPHCVCKVGSDILFVSSNGRLYSLQALRPDIDPIEADITARLNLTSYIRERVDATKLRFARLVYDESRKELFYYHTTSGGADTNDAALVFDLSEVQNGVFKCAQEDRGEFFQAAWKRIANTGFNEMLVAGAGGLVYRSNTVSRSIGGTDAYFTEFQTPDSDFKELSPDLAGAEKHYAMLEISCIPTGNYEMGFDIIVDGRLRKTISLNVGASEAAFDSGVFDTDTFGGRTLIKHRQEIDCVGNQISIRGFNSNLNEDFGIANMRIYYKPQGNLYEA